MSLISRVVWFAVSLASSFAPLRAGDDELKARPPQVGEVAPPLGGLGWLQLDEDAGGKAPDLLAMRGKVVVVTSYGHYCDSCVKSAVPTAIALRASNPGELCVVSFTGPWGEDTQEQILAEGRKLGIRHAIGWASYFAEDTPYLDMLSQPGLSHAYVISRAGGIVWKGDAATKRAEYLQAVRQALEAPALAPLEQAFAPELSDAVRSYVFAELGAVGPQVQSALKKAGSKATPQAQRVRDDAQRLLERLETSRKQLMDALEMCGGVGDGERFQKLLPQIRRAFPKGEESGRCDQLEMYIGVHTDKGPQNRAWAQWYELASQRPPTFPAIGDKAGQKYAKELAKHAKTPDAPGAKQARAWLERFEALAPEK
jgi:hypothetical protein